MSLVPFLVFSLSMIIYNRLCKELAELLTYPLAQRPSESLGLVMINIPFNSVRCFPSPPSHFQHIFFVLPACLLSPGLPSRTCFVNLLSFILIICPSYFSILSFISAFLQVLQIDKAYLIAISLWWPDPLSPSTAYSSVSNVVHDYFKNHRTETATFLSQFNIIITFLVIMNRRIFNRCMSRISILCLKRKHDEN